MIMLERREAESFPLRPMFIGRFAMNATMRAGRLFLGQGTRLLRRLCWWRMASHLVYQLPCDRHLRETSANNLCVTAQAIWDHSGAERKGKVPGSLDEYRETVYERNYKDQSFKVVRSVVDDSRAEEVSPSVQ
jgi:hypothetical protein